MTKRKLKDWVIPALSAIVLVGGIFTYNLISKLINYGEDNIPVLEIIDDTLPVDNEIIEETPILPFNQEGVELTKYYYEKDEEKTKQISSIIRYENIYMPNTGNLYTSETEFDIIAVLSGKVTNIKEDELLGNIIEIEHENNLVTIYQSVKNVQVNVGDEISQGDIIAKSNTNKIEENNKQCLHFEVYKNNKLINPEYLYDL